MPILNISPDIDNSLGKIFDCALKFAGTAILNDITKVSASIQHTQPLQAAPQEATKVVNIDENNAPKDNAA